MSKEETQKEFLELMQAVKILALAGKKIGKDGKINIADLPAFLGLVQQAQTIIEGVKGVKLINVKEIDPMVAIASIGEIVEAMKAE